MQQLKENPAAKGRNRTYTTSGNTIDNQNGFIHPLQSQKAASNRNGLVSPLRLRCMLGAALCIALLSPVLSHARADNRPAVHAAEDAELNIRFDSKSGKMSIKATDATITELVAKLEAAYEIRLFVIDVDMDTKVTCDVKEQFIDDALREALPAAARFFYRFNKAGEELEDRKPAALQVRSRAAVAPAIQKAQLKAQPAAMDIKPAEAALTEKRVARTAMIASPAGNMPVKLAATSIRAQNLAQPVMVQQSDDYYVKVVVKVTPNGYEPVSYTKIQGDLVEDSAATGDFVYQLKDNGREVFTGSFQDPLELHAYSQDGSHKVLQAKENYISITLPKQVLDKNAVQAPSLEFSKLRGEAVQDNRNIKRLQATALQRKGVISADALRKIMPR